MTAPLEQEFKFKLTAPEFAKLRKLSRAAPKLQTNYYFDTTRRHCAKARVGVRLRQEGKTFFLTVKLPAQGSSTGQGWHVKREWETKVSAATAKELLTGKISLAALRSAPARELRQHFTPAILSQIALIGKMENRRYRATLGRVSGKTIWLELDRFRMNGQTYYEAECETTSPSPTLFLLKQVWAGYRIPMRPEKLSKLARFLKTL